MVRLERKKTGIQAFLQGVTFILVFSGCSAEYKLFKLLKKNPGLLERYSVTDTTEKITRPDSAIFPVQYSITDQPIPKDTTINGIQRKYLPIANGFEEQIICPEDTVHCIDKFVEYRIRDPTFLDYKKQYLGWCFAILLFLAIIVRK